MGDFGHELSPHGTVLARLKAISVKQKSPELSRYNKHDEPYSDFNRWKGIYEIRLRRKQAYTKQMDQCELAETSRFQPTY